MVAPVATLIISTYSNTRALGAVLESVFRQSVDNFEIIVTEDAEHESVDNFLKGLVHSFPREIVHITQPDLGWAKNRALNRAVAVASTPYVIIIDGDCVLHPRFVESHLSLSCKGHIVAGKRVKLNEQLSERLIDSPARYLDKMPQMLRPYLFGLRGPKPKFIEEGFFFPRSTVIGFLLRIRSMKQLKGCNMSFYKEDLIAINGFDEEYSRPAIGEDIDLTWRFLRNGCRLRSARNLAVQYHLHHKENWTSQHENVAIMERNCRANKYVCENGIDQHLSSK